MQILGKTTDVNMRKDICFLATSSSKVADVNIEYVENINNTIDELFKEEKSVYNEHDFESARMRERSNKLVRIKRMEDKKRAGYVLISSMTCFGTLIVGTVIFMVIKLMLK